MSEPKQIIVFPRGQLAAKDKERMTKAGYLVVEADDPSRVVAIIPASAVATGDDVLYAALKALPDSYTRGPSERFGKFLAERVLARIAPVVPPDPSHAQEHAPK